MTQDWVAAPERGASGAQQSEGLLFPLCFAWSPSPGGTGGTLHTPPWWEAAGGKPLWALQWVGVWRWSKYLPLQIQLLPLLLQ